MGRSASGRGSLQDVVQMMQTEQPPPPQGPTVLPRTPTADTVSRPINTTVRIGSEAKATPKAIPTAEPAADAKSEKRVSSGSLALR